MKQGSYPDRAVERARLLTDRFVQRRRDLAVGATDERASAYVGLHRQSLALDGFRERIGGTPHLNLVLPDARTRTMFAGVYTALKVGARFSQALDLPLRVVSFASMYASEIDESRSRVVADFGLDPRRVTFVDVRRLAETFRDPTDTWLATHWTTAHCLQLLVARGRLDVGSVAYLIQDYEPSFYAASTEQALASATYAAGFTAIVNSAPLADTLRAYEGLDVPASLTFAPELDFERLAAVAARRSAVPPRVYLYGRPSVPRNMFGLGLATLREAVRRLPTDLAGTEFVSMGKAFPPIDLGSGLRLTSVGRLSWNAYFETLIHGQVLLSLQATPHPSHPPLDMVASGGRAVTNEIGGVRQRIHPRLAATPADPPSLAAATLAQLRSGLEDPSPEVDLGFVDVLGGPLDAAVGTLASSFRTR